MYSPSPFSRLARWISRSAGRPEVFAASALLILVWLATGPIFRFSDRWQLVISSVTNVATFLMVFLIQNTQSRDSEAMHVKLDELIRAAEGANKALLDLEEMSLEDLDRIQARYEELARRAREQLQRGTPDIGTADVQAG